jgi:hypothetical protein
MDTKKFGTYEEKKRWEEDIEKGGHNPNNPACPNQLMIASRNTSL